MTFLCIAYLDFEGKLIHIIYIYVYNTKRPIWIRSHGMSKPCSLFQSSCWWAPFADPYKNGVKWSLIVFGSRKSW